MPVYQYACPDCGYTFEKQQKFTDPPIKRCPRCGKRRVYRLVSQVAVTFKGSGWYITDSRGDSAKRADETTKADGEAKQPAKAEPATAEKAKSATTTSE
jgi:putative FmdB family regulatory protein